MCLCVCRPEDEPESPKATHTEKVKEKAAKASKADKGADKPIKTEKDTDVPIKAEKNTDKPIKTEKIKVPAAAPPGEKQLVRSTKAYRYGPLVARTFDCMKLAMMQLVKR